MTACIMTPSDASMLLRLFTILVCSENSIAIGYKWHFECPFSSRMLMIDLSSETKSLSHFELASPC